MTARRVVAAGVVALVVVVAALEPWDRETPRSVPWRDLTSRVGPLELARPANHSFEEERALRRFLATQTAAPVPDLPPIDFERERALVVSPGPRSSTGYAVEVVDVRRSGGGTVVVLRERTPSLGDELEPRVTYPYRLLAIPADDNEITFRWLGRP